MRSVVATIAAITVLAILAGGAFVYSGNYYVGADQPHWSMMAWLLNEARNRSIRAHATGITEPAGLDDPARIVAGVSHYSEHCAICHGAPGIQRSDIAEGLHPRPPNLAKSVKLYTPSELFWIVKHGIRMMGMPSWGGHSDDELWATVAFMEKLPGMTNQEYAEFVAASRAQGGHQHGYQQPVTETAPQPVEKGHDQPAASEAVPQPSAAGRDHPAGQQHEHPMHHHH